MWSSRGRPKSACTACKSQKIRCSGEQPICSRCARLRRQCIYKDTASPARSLRFVSDRRRIDRSTALPTKAMVHKSNCPDRTHNGAGNYLSTNNPPAAQSRPAVLSDCRDIPSFGILQSLLNTLVDMYFDNAYNASLLLHKERFLESLEAGTAESHLILSICAYAAIFYRDQNDEAPLRDHGFMVDWAKRAGSLVFQDAENLRKDNMVTFCILGTFWYTQGSWKLSYLHKANACNLLQIAGLSFVDPYTQTSVESEIQRRRFWACYLMQCALMENSAPLEAIVNISELPLPSADADYDVGAIRNPTATLENGVPGACVHAELIRGFKLWCTVFALVKLPESSVADRFTKIYALDNALTQWWSALRSDFKLTPVSLPSTPSMCALHASVVPLFSWTQSNHSWASARQASAQKTYEHAGTVSNLIGATLAAHPKLAMTHSFLAYAAYSGCAVQIPFMWSSNLTIKEQAISNVSKNVAMIQSMTPYWKFATLVQKQLGCLYRLHEQFSVDLEDEPKNVDVQKLVDFKINAINARTSLLGYTAILRSKDNGYARPGEEGGSLEIQDQNEHVLPQKSLAATTDHEDGTASNVNASEAVNIGSQKTNLSPYDAFLPPTETHHLDSSGNGYGHQTQTNVLPPDFSDDMFQSGFGQQSMDFWPPFFYPTMSDVLPNSEMLNLPQFDMDLTELNDFQSSNWFMATTS